jgi:hypothetical protein
MVQFVGVVNGKNVDEMRRYHEEINAKQRELQSQYGIRNVQQINSNVWIIYSITIIPIIKVCTGKCQCPLQCPKANQFPRPFGNRVHTGMGINTTITSGIQESASEYC